MPVTNYYNVGGQIVGEKPSGGNRRDYLTDALGSVVGTVTSTGAVENTYRYKPYGGLLARTGVASDPSFLWVGSQGYRQTGKKYSDVYVRARHYSSDVGRWTTRDPIGYDDGWNQYGYVHGNPILLGDPSGKQVPGQCYGNCGARITGISTWLTDEIKSQIAGWDKYAATFRPKTPPIEGSYWPYYGYLEWANGNQRYKKMAFSDRTSCGKRYPNLPKGARECGHSVSMCNFPGVCVFGGNLGNIMYGFMGAYAGYPEADIVRVAEARKKLGEKYKQGKFDPYDRFAYMLGWEMYRCAGGPTINKVKFVAEKVWCRCFLRGLTKYPQALYETNDKNPPPHLNDSSTCPLCQDATTTTDPHGGNASPSFYP